MSRDPSFPVFMDPVEKYPVGSVDWAGRMSARCQREFDKAETMGFRPFVQTLEQAVDGEPWDSWPAANPWGSVDAWAQTLFRLTWDKVLAIVESVDPDAAQRLRSKTARPQPAHGGDRRSEKVRDQGNDVTLKRGNRASYLAARLKRDHPEIAAAVERNEYPSMRAAARAAGIVKPPDPLRQLFRWWKLADEDQRDEFLREVS